MQGISFFIPAYNCARTIAEAVDSITETNFTADDELIIVNDFSSDNTPAVLENLQKKYPSIIVINHLRNKGGAAARNTGVEHARCELLFCLDADNVLAPASIAPLKKYLEENNAAVASFQYQNYFIVDKYKTEYTWSVPAGEVPASAYLNGENTPGQHGNYLFTKQSWLNAQGYAEGSGALDTWTFGLRQAITGAKIVALRDTFYYHRLNYGNSYWMQDAESQIWSVSPKAAHALFPFLNVIDEDFLNYMQGEGRYSWFYTLKKKPLKLIGKEVKAAFYQKMHQTVHNIAYPKPTIFTRAANKLKRMLKKII